MSVSKLLSKSANGAGLAGSGFSGKATFQGIVSGTGAVTGTADIYGSQTGTGAVGSVGDWVLLGTITLSGTTKAGDAFSVGAGASWEYCGAVASNITGTSALLEVYMGH